ncbi:hypothetical protein Tco_0157531 [Tanacetum coccineum]
MSNFMASQDAKISRFEADFKQYQSEMTNKLDAFLKAFSDRMTGVLPSDTVKNLMLNPDSTSSTRSYPTGDPQSSPNSFKSINAIQMCFKSTTNIQKDQLQVNTLTANEIKTPTPKEPEKALEDEFADLHLNFPVLEVLAHVPIYDALLDEYIVSLELGKNRPPKKGDGAWHIRIELIDPDGENFDRAFQSIPTTRKLSPKENPSDNPQLGSFP